MITENLSTLKIHKLTQAQYDRELEAGRIDETAIYLTPDEAVDLSGYATLEDLDTKANAVHSHDDLYYTEDEIDEFIAGIDTSISNITNGNTVVKNAEHATSADTATSATDADRLGGQLPSYYAKASDIPTGALASKDIISESDLDNALAEKVNAAADGNHSHSNKTVLDGITSEKVANWDATLASAQSYADAAAATVKNDLLNGAGGAYDTLKELGDLIDDNTDAISALETVAAGKADKAHTHAIADVTNLQTTLDAKATQIDLNALTEVVDGKAASVHTHAISDVTNLQTTLDAKAEQTSLDAHTSDTAIHITSAERTAWNAIEGNAKTYTDQIAADKSDKDHVHSIATDSANGFMSAAMATKLEGIADGATNVVVDSSLSASSTNAVQNSVVTSAINSAASAISANTSSITAHSTAITNLQTAMAEIKEITSDDISALFA